MSGQLSGLLSRHRRALLELALAVAAAVGCVVSWLESRSTVVVAPIASGEPTTTSVVFYAPLLVLALILATVAGVLAVVGLSRLRRLSRPRGDLAAPK